MVLDLVLKTCIDLMGDIDLDRTSGCGYKGVFSVTLWTGNSDPLYPLGVNFGGDRVGKAKVPCQDAL